MCDSGRLNYKWIGREDRLKGCSGARTKIHLDGGAQGNFRQAEKSPGGFGGDHRLGAADERRIVGCSTKLADKARRDHAIPFRALAKATNCSSVRTAIRTRNGARLTGICASANGHRNLPKIAEASRSGKIKTLIVFGEDVTKHGIGAEFARQAGDAHRQRHSAERDDEAGALSFARLRACGKARHVHERQGPRPEIHEGGRAARRCPAGMGIFARPGFQRHRPEWFRDALKVCSTKWRRKFRRSTA